jgi:O-antigen/teichoic acid export membrane protein
MSDELEQPPSANSDSPGPRETPEPQPFSDHLEDSPATGQTSVGQEAAKGVLWMTAQTWLARAGGLITIAILTRLLSPEDFGLLAVVSTLLTLTYVLSDLGLATYVVQAKTVDRRSLSTAFWVSLLGGLAISCAIFFGAQSIANLLRVPQAEPILQAMTVIIMLISLSSVPLALMRRRMQFRLLAFQLSIGAVLAQVTAIVAAFMGFGVWAMMIQLLVGQVVASAAQWFSAKWRPTLEFSRPDFSVMIRYGINIVGSGLVFVGRAWAETGIIAIGLGIRELGYLNIAQRLVVTATELAGAAILPVSTVAFAKVNSSKARLQAAHARAMAATQTVVAPLMIFIFVSAGVLVPFMFGPEWTVSAPIAQPLAIAAILSFGTVLDRGLLDGVGRPGRWLAFTSVICALSVGLIALAVPRGVLVVAVVYLVVALVELVGRWFLIGNFLETSVLSTARPFLVVVPAALGSALAGAGSMRLLQAAPDLVTLGVSGLVVLGVHLALTRWVSPDTWREMTSLIPARRKQAS